jgi:hypothetical protein
MIFIYCGQFSCIMDYFHVLCMEFDDLDVFCVLVMSKFNRGQAEFFPYFFGKTLVFCEKCSDFGQIGLVFSYRISFKLDRILVKIARIQLPFLAKF